MSQDASSRTGREETFGGGSAFERCLAGGFETVRVRECVTTTTRGLDDADVTGGWNAVVDPPLVFALCGAGALGAASAWISGCARGEG